jgi:hypothetical protein
MAEFINPVRATRHTLSLPVIYALYYFSISHSLSPPPLPRSLLLLLYLSCSLSLFLYLTFFFSTQFLCLFYSPCSFFSFNPIFLFSLYLELRLSSFSHPIMLCPFYFIYSFCIFTFCLSVYLSFSMSPSLVPVTVQGLQYILYYTQSKPECLSLRPHWHPKPPLPQASVSPLGTKKGGGNTRLRMKLRGGSQFGRLNTLSP